MKGATVNELAALEKLTALAHKKEWMPPNKKLSEDCTVLLAAPLSKVQKFLSKELKPGRRLVSAVRFTNGKMQEVTDAVLAKVDKAAEPKTLADKVKEGVAAAATTVAVPFRGCPAPDFQSADIRANAVLSAFLDPEQLRDFEEHNAFVSRGADTGHRYMVTSRHARGKLEKYSRSLFDLDENEPYCVHDWSIPAAEEMLAIHTLLSLPGHERWMRDLPEV